MFTIWHGYLAYKKHGFVRFILDGEVLYLKETPSTDELFDQQRMTELLQFLRAGRIRVADYLS